MSALNPDYVKKLTDNDFDYYHKETNFPSEEEKIFKTFQGFLRKKNTLTVNIGEIGAKFFDIHISSVKKIASMCKGDPEEFISFTYHAPEVYASYSDMMSNRPFIKGDMIEKPYSKETPTILSQSISMQDTINETRKGESTMRTLLTNESKEDIYNIKYNESIAKVIKNLYPLLILFGLGNLAYGLYLFIIKNNHGLRIYSILLSVLLCGCGVVGFKALNAGNYRNNFVLLLTVLSFLANIGTLIYALVSSTLNLRLVYCIVDGVNIALDLVLTILLLILRVGKEEKNILIKSPDISNSDIDLLVESPQRNKV